jgi:GTP pyrophosphokinase
MYEADRRIAVEWAKPLKVDKTDGRGTYPVKLTVFCDDRPAMLKQLTAVISDDNTNIRNIEARTADSQATIDIVIDIEDVKHLERVIGGLRKIPGIHDVQRLNKA